MLAESADAEEPVGAANSNDGRGHWNPMNRAYPHQQSSTGGFTMSFRLTKWVGTTAAAGLSAFTIFSGSAAGFFPPIPTGNDPPTVAPQVPVVPSVVVSPPPPRPIVQVSPPPFVPVVPKEVPPTVPPPMPPHYCPPGVPEPATVITALVGLSLVGVRAAKKKFGKKSPNADA